VNKQLSFKKIQEVTQGEWIVQPDNADQELSGGAFDTRSIKDAQIFFAWEGDQNDGHQYIHQLKDSSIRLIVVEKKVPPVSDIAVIKVTNSLQALHMLAKELMQGFIGKVVTITGSSGKTTAKAWLTHLLQNQFNLLSNIGSFNNHIGCPITILGIQPEHDLMILEMGTSGLGELELLSSIAPADITVLLNVGHAHLGKFGSLEKTYQAKTEIFSHQKKDAISLIPFDDEYLGSLMSQKQLEFFGQHSPCFSWQFVGVNTEKRQQTFVFQTPEGKSRVVVGELGEYVGDLLSAIIAICYFLEVTLDKIESYLAYLPQEKGRSTFVTGKNNSMILDDTYNANPESMINMLKTICSLNKKKSIGVVGNMAELDSDLKRSAKYILDNIPKTLDHLFLGGESGEILIPLIRAQYPELDAHTFRTTKEIIDVLDAIVDKDAVIGVKGSRSSHMERVVYQLKGQNVRCSLASCGKLQMCSSCDEI